MTLSGMLCWSGMWSPHAVIWPAVGKTSPCRESACSVVYKTAPYGFVCVPSLCLLLPAPFSGFTRFASEAVTSGAHRCCRMRDSAGWQLGASCSWTSEQTRWGGQSLRVDGGGWAKPHGPLPGPQQRAGVGLQASLVSVVHRTRQQPCPASRSRLTSQNPVQLVSFLPSSPSVRPRDFKTKQEAF